MYTAARMYLVVGIFMHGYYTLSNKSNRFVHLYFVFLYFRYMKIYGFKFSKEDHIALIKLFYELLLIPGLEPTRIQKFASTLSHLLK